MLSGPNLKVKKKFLKSLNFVFNLSHKHKHKRNELDRFSCAYAFNMLMSTQFSLANTYDCVYAYAYALVKTRL